MRPVEPLQHFHRPIAIGAVGDHQQLLAADRSEASQRRFDAEGARTLHENACIGFVAARQLEQAAPAISADDEFELAVPNPSRRASRASPRAR